MSLLRSNTLDREHLASGFDTWALQSPAAPALSLWSSSAAESGLPETHLSYAALAAGTERCQRLLQGVLGPDPDNASVAWSGGNTAGLAEVFLASVRYGIALVLFEPNWPSEALQSARSLVQPSIMLDETRLQQLPLVVTATELAVRGNADSRFLIGFTSGSSGTPKAFVRSQRSWLATLKAASEEFSPVPGRVVLAPGPLSHGLSFYALVETLHSGGHFMGLDKFDARVVLKVLQWHTVHTLVVVPTMLAALLDALDQVDRVAGLPRIVSAGAKLSPLLRERVQQHFPGTRVTEYYGASELSFVTVAQASESPPAASVGRAFTGVELELRTDAGHVVERGQEGTVWVRSEMLADGLLVDADTVMPLVDSGGWATVGDVGRLDRDGYLTLVDRASNMIITGGLNVYPANVEHVLRQHADLVEVVVVGIPDDYWGERLCAVCEVNKDNALVVAELRQLCSEYLAPHQRPARYYLTTDWPWTASTKIDRARLRQRVCEQSDQVERVA